ncbi:MAG TPA: hypothetical protein VGB85_32190, partial [Nannocystis sp.]
APGLVEVLARCLQRAPERRFASAQALSDALAPFERTGERMTLTPVTPEPRASARAIAAMPATPARPVRAPGLPAPSRAPSGSHVPVPAGPSGSHRVVPSSGPLSEARPVGALPVPRDMKRTGPLVLPPELKRSGIQAVPKDIGRGAAPVQAAARVVPARQAPGDAYAWLWGVLLALLGGGLVLIAVLRQ